MNKGRYVQIDAFYGGSTGSLMRKRHKLLTEEGWDSYIFWGRGPGSLSDHEVKFTRSTSVYAHAFLSRIFDRAGFYSKGDTKKLLRGLEEIQPDIVHLHGLQGYYINMPLLFEWLGTHECKVRITLHDCWLMTGHCPHFSYYGCNRWKTQCHDCPLQREYPASYFLDRSKRNHLDKKALLGLLDPMRTEIICPSGWMKGLAEQSHLSRFECVVENNQIDLEVFRPVRTDFRKKKGIGDRFLILGVAANWTNRKGLKDFIALNEMLNSEDYQILLIGLSDRQIKELPDGIIGLPRTDSQEELVEAYSSANVFVNPTYEDNYPTVNLEAEACGTPVVCYNTGGCGETIRLKESCLVATGNLAELAQRIKNIEVSWETK